MASNQLNVRGKTNPLTTVKLPVAYSQLEKKRMLKHISVVRKEYQNPQFYFRRVEPHDDEIWKMKTYKNTFWQNGGIHNYFIEDGNFFLPLQGDLQQQSEARRGSYGMSFEYDSSVENFQDTDRFVVFYLPYLCRRLEAPNPVYEVFLVATEILTSENVKRKEADEFFNCLVLKCPFLLAVRNAKRDNSELLFKLADYDWKSSDLAPTLPFYVELLDSLLHEEILSKAPDMDGVPIYRVPNAFRQKLENAVDFTRVRARSVRAVKVMTLSHNCLKPPRQTCRKCKKPSEREQLFNAAAPYNTHEKSYSPTVGKCATCTNEEHLEEQAGTKSQAYEKKELRMRVIRRNDQRSKYTFWFFIRVPH